MARSVMDAKNNKVKKCDIQAKTERQALEMSDVQSEFSKTSKKNNYIKYSNMLDMMKAHNFAISKHKGEKWAKNINAFLNS